MKPWRLRLKRAWFRSTPRIVIGPRPCLVLHHGPEPRCPWCDGSGTVMGPDPSDPEQPSFDPCGCATVRPLLWLPHLINKLHRPRTCNGCHNKPCTCTYSNEPPF